jgi:hypothetical protein
MQAMRATLKLSGVALSLFSTALASLWVASGAWGAKVQQVTDTANLQLVSADGNTLIETGKASGTMPGNVHVSLTLGTSTATSEFTIYTKNGTITGRAQGKLKPGKGGWESFGGALAVQRGTGRFHKALGKGDLYGAIERVDDSLRVQVTGRLQY